MNNVSFNKLSTEQLRVWWLLNDLNTLSDDIKVMANDLDRQYK